ncbi:uncharacterized protein B0H18DRAFT_958494 [Fomitopsis serialis]|uniref:uncharacterized protein n=1 Tax=Fomitopsis serialis TaxID=139415 RepID=UPI0020077244|nr:uncharacterized protein B0H18DRAFT_958494 [Neoantrodia serialis]KAH9917202.1 hypothetical protein B0H18DRAFT_958494 [Neoantrodia serialis]
MPTEFTDLNLSDRRVVLTCAVLNINAIPADGVYLEVIATVRLFELDGEPTCHITTTDTTDEVPSLPFDDRSQTGRGRLSGTAEEGGHQETSNSRANDSTNTSSLLTDLDDVTSEDQAAIFTPMTHIDEDNDDEFWDMICRATGYYLYDHPEKFAEAKEVYMVRVPYWIEDRWTIRFYFKKEVNDTLMTCLTSPPLAYYWTGIVERRTEELPRHLTFMSHRTTMRSITAGTEPGDGCETSAHRPRRTPVPVANLKWSSAPPRRHERNSLLPRKAVTQTSGRRVKGTVK